MMTTLTSIPGVVRWVHCRAVVAAPRSHGGRPMRLASVMAAGETLTVECQSDLSDAELVGTWREIDVQRRTARVKCGRSAS